MVLLGCWLDRKVDDLYRYHYTQIRRKSFFMATVVLAAWRCSFYAYQGSCSWRFDRTVSFDNFQPGTPGSAEHSCMLYQTLSAHCISIASSFWIRVTRCCGSVLLKPGFEHIQYCTEAVVTYCHVLRRLVTSILVKNAKHTWKITISLEIWGRLVKLLPVLQKTNIMYHPTDGF